jgi:hypothetical protein
MYIFEEVKGYFFGNTQTLNNIVFGVMACVTFHSSLTVQPHARQVYILTNRTTALGVYSQKFGRFIADLSVENTNPHLTP